jgi:hypothetical protein
MFIMRDHEVPWILTSNANNHTVPCILTTCNASNRTVPWILTTCNSSNHKVPWILTTFNASNHTVPCILTTCSASNHKVPWILTPCNASNHTVPCILTTCNSSNRIVPCIPTTCNCSNHEVPWILTTCNVSNHSVMSQHFKIFLNAGNLFSFTNTDNFAHFPAPLAPCCRTAAPEIYGFSVIRAWHRLRDSDVFQNSKRSCTKFSRPGFVRLCSVYIRGLRFDSRLVVRLSPTGSSCFYQFL